MPDRDPPAAPDDVRDLARELVATPSHADESVSLAAVDRCYRLYRRVAGIFTVG